MSDTMGADAPVKDKKQAKRQMRKSSLLSLLCLIFIIVPNFNIIDFLPDLVSYLILAHVFGKYADQVPYFAEARDAFRKLAIVTAVKIPAMLVMAANMSSGRDIVTLFTLVFVTIELMLLFGAVRNSFSALYYLGERGSCKSTVSPFSALGIAMRPETLETATIVYLAVRGVLNVIPDMFLLTSGTAEVQYVLRSMFPMATLICMSVSLILGIVWLIFTQAYAVAISREGMVGYAAREIAGEERIAEIERGKSRKSALFSLTLLFVSSILCFDVSFEGVNSGISILPAFVWALVIIFCGLRLFDREIDKMLTLIFCIIYSAVSVYTDYVETEWETLYDQADLSYLTTAKDAYIPIEVLSLVELALMAAIAVFFARGLLHFIENRIIKKAPNAELSRIQLKLSKSLTRRTVVFAAVPVLLTALRCVNVFLKTDVRFIPVDSSDAAVSAVVTTPAPWIGIVIVALTVLYVFYSYFYISELKGEIKLKEEQ